MSVAVELRLDSVDAVPDSTARTVLPGRAGGADERAQARTGQRGQSRSRSRATTGTRADRLGGQSPGRQRRPSGASSSPAAIARVLSLPGAGTGLIGLAERVTLAGGSLTHAPTADGGYALRATLPLPA